MTSFARAQLLGVHDIQFWRCASCGFVCTQEPFWLEEAYSSAITGSDVGLVQRNFHLAKIARVVLSAFFNPSGRFLDFAGGYGLLVRMMRDSGFDFTWHDPYCTNLFATAFTADLDNHRHYELITAFEVFEHLADPVTGLDNLLKHSKNVLFTTDLLPETAPQPQDWWYYGLEHGQHVSFYTRRSLEKLAENRGLNFYSNGATVHLFTEKKISALLFFLLARHKTARLIAPFVSNKSLLEDDFRTATGRGMN